MQQFWLLHSRTDSAAVHGPTGQLMGILSVRAHVGCGAGHVSGSEKSNTGPQKKSQLRNLVVGSSTSGNNVEGKVRMKPGSEELPPLLW